MNKKKTTGLIIGLTVLVIVIGCGIIAGAIFSIVKYQRASKNFPSHFYDENTVYYTEDKSIVLYSTEKGKPNVALVTKDNETNTYIYWYNGVTSSLQLGNYVSYEVTIDGKDAYQTEATVTLSDPSLSAFTFQNKLIYNEITYYSETRERTTEKKKMKFSKCSFEDWEGTIPDGETFVENQKAPLKAKYETEMKALGTANTVYFTVDKSFVVFNAGTDKPMIATYTKDGMTTTYLVTRKRAEITLFTYVRYRKFSTTGYTYDKATLVSFLDFDVETFTNEERTVYGEIYNGKTNNVEKVTTEFYSCPFSEWQGEIPDGTTYETELKAKLKAEYEAKQN